MPRDSSHSTWNTRVLENLFDVRPNRDIYYTEGITDRSSLSPGNMPAVYQLWDGLLYLSGGEGFGMPAWEAMSVGIPVIYSNYSSHAEFLAKAEAGLPVEGTLQPERGSCTLRLVANISEVIQAIRRLYFDRKIGIELGLRGRAFTAQHSVRIQVERWHRLFQDVVNSP